MILPTPQEVRAARLEAGLTQKQAGRIVHMTATSWGRFEALPSLASFRQISETTWDLFLLRTLSRRPKSSRFRVRRP